jgi:hypothetical protein
MKPACVLLFGSCAFLSASAATGGEPSRPLLATEFPARVLAAHNQARTDAGVTPLQWDDALGTEAAAYAQRMAYTNIFEHSDRKARRGIGENLWMGTHGAYPVEAMVGAWVSEKRMFSPGVFPAVSRSGNWIDVAHYTQVIWPTTQRLGCALASNGRTDYLVCHYAPSGNMDGKSVP